MSLRNLAQAFVVVGILGVVACFGVVGMVNVRMAAQKARCASNLKQLALAVSNYHGQELYYPPATVSSREISPQKRLSWYVLLHPYIEAGPRLLLDPGEPWDSPKNYPPYEGPNKEEPRDVRRPSTGHKCLQCPANYCPPEEGSTQVTHCIGVAGLATDSAEQPLGAPGIGFFGYDRKLRDGDIKDGKGATLIILETQHNPGPFTAGGPPTVRGLDQDPNLPFFGYAGQWTSKHPWTDSAEKVCITAAFADASVHQIHGKISPDVFRALATIAGGEDVTTADLP